MSIPWRITIVDDGSRDEDSRRMRECVRLCGSRVEFHRLPVNLGKGGAIHSGWNADHESEWLGLLDADGSIPPHEVVRLLNSLGQDDAPDAFFASRCKILGRTVQRPGADILGDAYLRRLFPATGIPVYDSQCGFKLIRRRCDEAIRSRLRQSDPRSTSGFCRPHTIRREVIEVPIDWCDVPGGKLRPVRDTVQMLSAVVGMRRRRDHDASHR